MYKAERIGVIVRKQIATRIHVAQRFGVSIRMQIATRMHEAERIGVIDRKQIATRLDGAEKIGMNVPISCTQYVQTKKKTKEKKQIWNKQTVAVHIQYTDGNKARERESKLASNCVSGIIFFCPAIQPYGTLLYFMHMCFPTHRIANEKLREFRVRSYEFMQIQIDANPSTT